MSSRSFLRRCLFPIHVAAVCMLVPACSDDAGDGPLDAAVDVDTQAPEPDTGADSPDTAAPDAGRSAECQDQDTKLQAALDAVRRSPNAVLAVRNAACGTTVYASGDPKSGTANSLWRVGSVTKTYVAATILTLVRDKKLSLSDPLSKWVPDLPKTDGVTVKMLLNHTSGIYHVSASSHPELQNNPLKEWTPSELVALASAEDPYFAPGQGWHYSNTNYYLLGMIIEEATGKKAAEAIRARVLEPAGLKHTFLDGYEPLSGTLGHGFAREGYAIHALYSMSAGWTGAGIAASAADVCDWMFTLFATDKVLTAAERNMVTDGAITCPDRTKYGLGAWMLEGSMTMGAGPAVMHFGSAPGYKTQAVWFPDKQLAVCSIENQDLFVGKYLAWPVRMALNALGDGTSMMVDLTIASDGTELAGATVCPYENGGKSTQCMQTSANGSLAFTAKLNDKIGLFYSKAGYESVFMPLVITEPISIWTPTWDDARVAVEYPAAGGTYPPGQNGHLLAFAVKGPGSTFTINPQAGVGPVYSDGDNKLDPALQSAVGNQVMYFDLPPGKYELTVTSPKTCKLNAYGWPSSSGKQNATEVEIHAGHLTRVPFFCE